MYNKTRQLFLFLLTDNRLFGFEMTLKFERYFPFKCHGAQNLRVLSKTQYVQMASSCLSAELLLNYFFFDPDMSAKNTLTLHATKKIYTQYCKHIKLLFCGQSEATSKHKRKLQTTKVRQVLYLAWFISPCKKRIS